MHRKDSGFTLIELLVTLAIAAIALTLGMPAFSDLLQRMRVDSTMHLLSADMAMARGRAVMRNAQVVVCPRDAGHRCAESRDWSQGWLVFEDADKNRQPDSEADILRIEDPPAGSAVLTLPSTRPYLRYQSSGRSANANLTVHVCMQGRLAGKVIVNNAGRVRTERPRSPTPCPRG